MTNTRAASRVAALFAKAGLTGAAIFFLAALTARPAAPHHGNAAYDTSHKATVKAMVTEWYWANPHCWLKFDVKDDKGNVAHWVAEASNPPDMVNRGWSKLSFKPGDEVSVTMLVAKNGENVGRIEKVVFPDGHSLGMDIPKQTGEKPKS